MDYGCGISCIDFSKDPKDLIEGSEGWKKLCIQVREACANYGGFRVVYDRVPDVLHEEMLKGLKELFDLPDEIKMKNSGSVHHGYLGKFEGQPLYESLGIHNAPILEQAQDFTDLLWPNGNPAFCQTLNSMSKMMQELEGLVRKMIFESLGVKHYYDSHIKDNDYLFRVMKYSAPFSDDWTLGLSPHTDQDLITILYEDRQGLEILSKEGQWLQVVQQPKTFVVMVGKTLMAWSNGRMHAPKHRVMVKGEKDRYSYGLFVCLKEGVIVETPTELVDKDHPLLFRPFNYRDYIQYLRANFYLDSALDTFAGTGGRAV
ncbi:hypothetical protein MKW98_028872 [Papaver atlanticum]|uniref:2-oxoglutarate-dependent dioxygenase DAO n=1 Tax=Papaver atlanticum TaxID=357466 RepID=A0AAD4S2H9_9MAGN|nr:hypothetical protein MKW98_028872 [Papaver atlanticum]